MCQGQHQATVWAASLKIHCSPSVSSSPSVEDEIEAQSIEVTAPVVHSWEKAEPALEPGSKVLPCSKVHAFLFLHSPLLPG